MPRRSKAELLAEYDDKLELFKIIWEWEKQFRDSPVPDDIDPVNISIKRRGKAPISSHLSGLQQAINDSLEMARDASPKDRAQLSDMLKKANQPTLSELDTTLTKKFQNVLQRNKINNEEEYYLVVERLNDTDNALTPTEIRKISNIVADFESRQK